MEPREEQQLDPLVVKRLIATMQPLGEQERAALDILLSKVA